MVLRFLVDGDRYGPPVGVAEARFPVLIGINVVNSMAALPPLEIKKWHLSGWNDFFDRDKTITENILAGRRRCLGWVNCAVLSLGRSLPPRPNSGPSRRPPECLKSAASRQLMARRLLRAQNAIPHGTAEQGAPYVAGFPALRSWETAVTSCAGANGLVRRMLLGTPWDGQSAALPPVI
jgi:hypothetical protein